MNPIMEYAHDPIQHGGSQPQKRAVVYSRFATAELGQGLQVSIADDVARARTWAELQGIEITRTFADGPEEGLSVPRNPGFKAMLHAAERGEFEVLIIRDLARIKRTSAAVSFWIEEFEALGVGIRQMDVDH